MHMINFMLRPFNFIAHVIILPSMLNSIVLLINCMAYVLNLVVRIIYSKLYVFPFMCK